MKNFLFSFLAVATLIGCGKNDDDNNNNGSGNNGNNSTSIEKLVKKITKKDSDGNLIEVTTIDFKEQKPTTQSVVRYNNGVQTGTTQVTTFTYEGNFVTKIKREGAGGDNYEKKISYENGKVSTVVEKYVRDSHAYTLKYSYIGNQLINVLETIPTNLSINGSIQSGTFCKESQYNYNGNIVTKIKISYEKDKDGKVVNGSTFTGTTTTYTFSNENIVKDDNGEDIDEYKYDTQHNPLRYGNLDPEALFYPQRSKNNLLESSTTRNGTKTTFSYKYTYNKEGYPLTVKHYENNQLVGTTEYEY